MANPPLNVPTRMQGQFDRRFDSWMEPAQTREERGPLMPAYDLLDQGSEYLLQMDIPGVPKEEIRIEVSDESIQVSGERKRKGSEDGDPGRSYRERFYGGFSRIVQLPSGVDSSNARATCREGVLEIRLPKLRQSKTRRLEISDAFSEKASDEASLVPEPKKTHAA